MSRLQFLTLVMAATLTVLVHGEPGEEVSRTLDLFHRAAAEADVERYLGALTDHVVFMGTDGSERWQGAAFREFVASHFSRAQGWTYTTLERNVSLAPDGQTAWFDEVLQNALLGRCRGSGVALRTAEGWKIAQYNLSVPIPNGMVERVGADIAAFDNPAAGAASAAQSPAVTGAAPDSMETGALPDQSPSTRSKCQRKGFKTNRPAGCQR